MFTITMGVSGKDMKTVAGDYRRMTNRGAEEVAKKTAEYLRRSAEAYSLIWRGTLLDSIKVERISRTHLAVKMAFWGAILEKGHVIKPGRIPSLLITWARSERGLSLLESPEEFLAAVKKSGHEVKKRPWISDAMTNIERQIEPIMKDNLRVR